MFVLCDMPIMARWLVIVVVDFVIAVYTCSLARANTMYYAPLTFFRWHKTLDAVSVLT